MDPNTSHAFTPLEIPQTPSPEPSKKKKNYFPNILLITSLISFVISSGYYVQTQQMIADSQAAAEEMQISEDVPEKPPQPEKADLQYPLTYKEQEIPQSLFEEAQADQNDEGKAGSHIETVMKYYIYRDLLEETDNDVVTTFDELVAEVERMEPEIIDTFLSTASFGYITARFADFSDEEEVKSKFADPKESAESIIAQYLKSLESNQFSIEQMIDVSNKDTSLQHLNEGELNRYFTKYNSTQNPYPDDPGFEKLVFSQEFHTPSKIYKLKNKEDKPYALTIVYVKNSIKKQYSSLEQLLSEHRSLFTF